MMDFILVSIHRRLLFRCEDSTVLVSVVNLSKAENFFPHFMLGLNIVLASKENCHKKYRMSLNKNNKQILNNDEYMFRVISIHIRSEICL